MGTEIERKFLITSLSEVPDGEAVLYHQGYLSDQKERVVRVRILGSRAYLTVKGISVGATRLEYEYEIPITDAAELLENLCLKPTILKHRRKVVFEGFTWEVDIFHGENEGLILAEIELKHEAEKFIKPRWVGQEVTGAPRYYNSNLIRHPFKSW
ncbi:MAG: CYTH domain-containing protein [FCB group bacterium]|nr:CYTH domain-containing protein [FCB group bacterium]